ARLDLGEARLEVDSGQAVEQSANHLRRVEAGGTHSDSEERREQHRDHADGQSGPTDSRRPGLDRSLIGAQLSATKSSRASEMAWAKSTIRGPHREATSESRGYTWPR